MKLVRFSNGKFGITKWAFPFGQEFLSKGGGFSFLDSLAGSSWFCFDTEEEALEALEKYKENVRIKKQQPFKVIREVE